MLSKRRVIQTFCSHIRVCKSFCNKWYENVFMVDSGPSGVIQSFGRCVVLKVKYSEMFRAIHSNYVVESKSFRPDQLFKGREIKQLCYFST